MTLHEPGSERSCCLKCVDFTDDFSRTSLLLPPGLTCPCLLESTRVSRWVEPHLNAYHVTFSKGAQKKKKKSKHHIWSLIGMKRQQCSIKHSAVAFFVCLFNSVPYFLIPSDSPFHIMIIIFFKQHTDGPRQTMV